MAPGLARSFRAACTTLLGALLLAACSAPRDAVDARPAMWLVADEDTTIYLLGTMHALPEGISWDGAEVGRAIDAADELVMELAPAELALAADVFERLAPRSRSLAIDARLSGDALAAYRALEANAGGFGGDRLDDWALLVLMGQQVASDAGLSPAEGVEAVLAKAFRSARKPISGLETAERQLMIFETLDAAAQRRLLVRAAQRAGDAPARVRALAAAWTRGDVAALERMINEDIDAVPEARDAIVTNRNRAWARWTENRLEQPGILLVAVGAGHLVGDAGLPAMLAARGLQVRRIQ